MNKLLVMFGLFVGFIIDLKAAGTGFYVESSKRKVDEVEQPVAKRRAKEDSQGNPTMGINFEELRRVFLEQRVARGLSLPPEERSDNHK